MKKAMRPSKILALTVVLAMSAGATGCAGVGRALGLTKASPDEFAIITKAPLVLPPDYSLRPPRPGEIRAQDSTPRDRAEQAIFGAALTSSTPPSQGEIILVQKAIGPMSANPDIRKILNSEIGGIIEKDRAFADRILFWRPTSEELAAEDVKAAAERNEQARLAEIEAINEAIGEDAEVTIKRSKALSLPGVF